MIAKKRLTKRLKKSTKLTKEISESKNSDSIEEIENSFEKEIDNILLAKSKNKENNEADLIKETEEEPILDSSKVHLNIKELKLQNEVASKLLKTFSRISEIQV